MWKKSDQVVSRWQHSNAETNIRLARRIQTDREKIEFVIE
jgi:hypothetical protein